MMTMICRRLCLAIGGAVLPLALAAAQPQWPAEPTPDAFPLAVDAGAAGLARALAGLGTRASMIAVVAHPDDEDGALLTEQARGRGARTELLTLTRGEGGQNAQNDDFGQALGLIRTQELLAADRYYGVEQYWGQVIDFGFSKSAAETLRQWGPERALEDAVRVIRKTRPLVITSSFVGGESDGHGHHQVAGMVAQQAFEAAADPTRFPEQLTQEGLRPWRALKVYGRLPWAGGVSYATGKPLQPRFFNYVEQRWIEGPLSADVEVPVGDWNSLAGASYTQLARQGLGAQKTQAIGTSPLLPGATVSEYHRFASRVRQPEHESDFYDGIDVSLIGIADLAPVADRAALRLPLQRLAQAVARASAAFDARRLVASAPALAEGLRIDRALIARLERGELVSEREARLDVLHELQIKEHQFNDALVLALGVNLTAVLSPAKPEAQAIEQDPLQASSLTVAPGDALAVNLYLTAQGEQSLPILELAVEAADGRSWSAHPEGPTPTRLTNNTRQVVSYRLQVPADAAPTRPYFEPARNAWYEIGSSAQRNRSQTPYPLNARLRLEYAGQAIAVEQVVQGMQEVPGIGRRPEPLLVAPPLSVSVQGGVGIIPLTGGVLALSATVRSYAAGPGPWQGQLRVELPSGWHSDGAVQPFVLERAGEAQQFQIRVQVPPAAVPSLDQIRVSVEWAGHRYDEALQLVGYPGLRPSPLYTAAAYPVRRVDYRIASGLRIGYVQGTGDALPDAIRSLGAQVQLLSDADLAQADLSQWDAIVVGIGAYDGRAGLLRDNRRLLDYAQAGGVLIVQTAVGRYDGLAPFPLTLGATADQVTEEDAPVTILQPAHPLLQWPNLIGTDDFQGWVDQRGDGFIVQWDRRYQALLESADDGQPAQRGGLLYARYGRGAFIYTAYALYRQVPAGVPGGIRLLANLLSHRRALQGEPSRP
ncbi:MAG: PIG-L family deacetylase [Pseudoxanthomonas sp.]